MATPPASAFHWQFKKNRASLSRWIKESILAETVVALRNWIKNFLKKRNFELENDYIITKDAVLEKMAMPPSSAFHWQLKNESIPSKRHKRVNSDHKCCYSQKLN